MQTEDSILPVVELNTHKTVTRKTKPSRDSTLETKKLSPCRSTLPSSNKKCLNPLPGAPYRDSMKQQSLTEEPKSSRKSILGQRVMSAKMLRFKQLQNQLADAHYHLNELANENRLLKALQKRQDSALRRYEGANAELPKLINSHHEELRVLQTKYKKLKELHKDTCNLLKEKENELYSVNLQNKHLLQLSKDRNLEEREKLQLQLSDVNYKMQQQQDTIQLLQRKLALETKSLKHQLHVEMSKHKETQKNLQETIEKLKSLECLLDNREKRLYYNGQLPIHSKDKSLGSRSLTNLRDVSISNSIKISSRNKKNENNSPKDNFPSLDNPESNDEKITQPSNFNHNRSVDQLKSETMASLQQIRKFRLQRSSNIKCKSTHSMDDLRFKSKDLEMGPYDDERITLTDYKTVLEKDESNNDESGKLRKFFNRLKNPNSQKMQKEFRTEFDYSSDDRESENEYYIQSYDSPKKSRELFARLINSTDDTSDTLDDTMKKVEYSEEELNTRLAKDLTFQKHKYKNRSQVLHHRNNKFYDSSSDIDFEEKMDANKDSSIEYKSNNFQTSSSKYAKEQFDKSFNGITHSEHNTLDVSEISDEKLKDLRQRISDDNPNNINIEDIETSQQSPNSNKWQLLKNNEMNNSSTDIRKQYYTNEEETRNVEDDPIYPDISHGEIHDDTDNAYEEIKHLLSLEEKKDEKDSQEIYEEEYIIKHSNKNDQHNLEQEHLESKEDEMLSCRSGKDTSKKNNINTEIQNKLDVLLEDVDALSNDVPVSQIEPDNSIKNEKLKVKLASNKKKIINYNKEKLLATMKAIDDNENIEYLGQGFKSHNISKVQIMENLHRGLPAHSKPKRDIIRDIFEDNHIESKVRGTCSKSH